ncbi:zinc finger protein 436-like isoform X2 [Cydia splendana]|uniref:zinc finger protein 436-like isoform X2 n=1 Tax=Cydia splendana TaxID=1100963 RepID=UPI00300CEB69
MSSWNCCRTCLGTASLSPIFLQTEHSEHYTNVILIATGVKVEVNDCLPQEVCQPCVSFINETMKFRKKCELAQITLRNRLNDNTHNIKQEFNKPDTISIDISEYVDDDFKDYDDNITLNTLQLSEETLDNKCTENIDDIKNIETENKVQETTDNKVILEKVKKEVKKRRVKKKEMNGQKVKEEIECEYCHKILTSKLSIRNHYKIHTGFDVVCEIHERLHTGEKPYVCEQCGAGFHRKSSYLQHIAIHLPEKTVQCTVCPARFKSVTLMRIHAARHRAPRYTFQCTLCENSFARRRNVARHVQRIHGLPPEPDAIIRRKIA